MPRATIWHNDGSSNGRGHYSYIDLPDPRPTGPTPLTPMTALFGWLMILMGLFVLAVFIFAANEPNPGDVDYVSPGTSQSETIED